MADTGRWELVTDWTGQQNWAAAARGAARPVQPADRAGDDRAAESGPAADPWADLRESLDGPADASASEPPAADAGSTHRPATTKPAWMRARLAVLVAVAVAIAVVVLGGVVILG